VGSRAGLGAVAKRRKIQSLPLLGIEPHLSSLVAVLTELHLYRFKKLCLITMEYRVMSDSELKTEICCIVVIMLLNYLLFPLNARSKTSHLKTLFISALRTVTEMNNLSNF
jgi:hypothetical protein